MHVLLPVMLAVASCVQGVTFLWTVGVLYLSWEDPVCRLRGQHPGKSLCPAFRDSTSC